MFLGYNSFLLSANNGGGDDTILFCEISSVFRFHILIRYGTAITTYNDKYMSAIDIIEFGQTIPDNNNMNDNSYRVRRLTNNIANLDIGISKIKVGKQVNEKGETIDVYKYYLHINKTCELYVYAQQNDCPLPMLVPLKTPIKEGFEKVQTLDESPFVMDIFSKKFTNIKSGFIIRDSVTGYLYYNYKNINNIANFTRLSNITKIPSNSKLKFKYNAISNLIRIIISIEGFSIELNLSNRIFTYQGITYHRVYPCFTPIPCFDKYELPKIYYDDEYIYIDNIGNSYIEYCNQDFDIVNTIDTANLKLATNIMKNSITNNVKESTLYYDENGIIHNKLVKDKNSYLLNIIKTNNDIVYKIPITDEPSQIQIYSCQEGYTNIYNCSFRFFKFSDIVYKRIFIKKSGMYFFIENDINFYCEDNGLKGSYFYIVPSNNTNIIFGTTLYEEIPRDLFNAESYNKLTVISDKAEDVTALINDYGNIPEGTKVYDIKTKKLAIYDSYEQSSNKWKDTEGNDINAKKSGLKADRPKGVVDGFAFLDKSLVPPQIIYKFGNKWIKADGSNVDV